MRTIVTRLGRVARIAVVATVLAAASAPVSCASATPVTPPAETARALLTRIDRDLDIQTEFPGRQQQPSGLPALPLPNISELATVLLWATVAFGAVALALVLKDVLPGGLARRGAWGGGDGPGLGGLAQSRAEAGLTADELARRGDYAAAMHLLLLTSLGDLRRRLDLRFADSLTSREILRHVTLEDAGKRAFAALVVAVELVHFGARPAGNNDYAEARDHFDRLTAALEGRAA